MALGTLVLVNPPKGASKKASKSRRKTKMARTTRSRTKKTTKRTTRKPTRKGTKASRSAAAKKAWRTRRRNASAKSRSAKKATSSSRRRPTKSRSTAAKRSAAARKAAKTRKANAAKRSRAAKKAAATRKRNSSKRKTSRKSGKRKTSRRTAAKKAAATRKRNAAKRSRAAKKAAATRRRNSGKRRTSKRRTSKRRTSKRRTRRGKLGKMLNSSSFMSYVSMGVGAAILGAVGLGVYSVASGLAINYIPSQLMTTYSGLLANLGGFSATADALIKVGLGVGIVGTAMTVVAKNKMTKKTFEKLAGSKGNTAIAMSMVAFGSVFASQLLTQPGVMGSGLLSNVAAGNYSSAMARLPGFKGARGLGMSGHSNNHTLMQGGHNNNLQPMMGMSNMGPMQNNQAPPNNNSNLFGTRKASRGRVNLF